MWSTFGVRRRVATWTFEISSSGGAAADARPTLAVDGSEGVGVLDRITEAIRSTGQRLEPSLTLALALPGAS